MFKISSFYSECLVFTARTFFLPEIQNFLSTCTDEGFEPVNFPNHLPRPTKATVTTSATEYPSPYPDPSPWARGWPSWTGLDVEGCDPWAQENRPKHVWRNCSRGLCELNLKEVQKINLQCALSWHKSYQTCFYLSTNEYLLLATKLALSSLIARIGKQVKSGLAPDYSFFTWEK